MAKLIEKLEKRDERSLLVSNELSDETVASNFLTFLLRKSPDLPSWKFGCLKKELNRDLNLAPSAGTYRLAAPRMVVAAIREGEIQSAVVSSAATRLILCSSSFSLAKFASLHNGEPCARRCSWLVRCRFGHKQRMKFKQENERGQKGD